MQMEISMKANGKMTKLMDMVLINMLMGPLMLEIGKTINNMVKE
jgi:hypothetical protein